MNRWPESRQPRSRIWRGVKIVVMVGVLGTLVWQSRVGTQRPAAAERQRPTSGTPRDWEIAREHFVWARGQRTDADPRFGDLLARIGERFVGTPYQPHTLEVPGPERLVINLEALDCVTFVENVLTLARLAWTAPPGLADSPAGSADNPAGLADDPAGFADDRAGFQAAFRDELTRIRYRDGTLDGYASRLHYFSEWIADNEAAALVESVSRELGGARDASPIDFMSNHPDAYRQLADPATLDEIARIEDRFAAVARFYIPEGQIGATAHLIRDGDIIAATSTVAGLDIAHTGIAVWRDGDLRLLHAPLVGSHVQLSEESLAERILRIEGQDGIMVARPIAPGTGALSGESHAPGTGALSGESPAAVGAARAPFPDR